MKKRRGYTLSKKLMAAMLSVFIIVISINPEFISYTYANSTKIQGVFNETLSEDKSSAVINLIIDELANKTMESITLPDQHKIMKENFKRDDNNKLLFEYKITENKKVDFVVEYTEVKQAGIPSEIKKETLSYEVKDIVVSKELTLKIDAKDITYKVGEKIDFIKDITINDEMDKDITSQLNLVTTSYDNYIEGTPGSYEVSYMVKHPISQKEYTFSRRVNVEELTKEKEVTNEKEVLDIKEGFNLSLLDWKESAKTYNITLTTAMAKLSTGNVIRIHLPQYTKLVTTPSANVNIEKVDSIGSSSQSTGTDIFIHMKVDRLQ